MSSILWDYGNELLKKWREELAEAEDERAKRRRDPSYGRESSYPWDIESRYLALLQRVSELQDELGDRQYQDLAVALDESQAQIGYEQNRARELLVIIGWQAHQIWQHDAMTLLGINKDDLWILLNNSIGLAREMAENTPGTGAHEGKKAREDTA